MKTTRKLMYTILLVCTLATYSNAQDAMVHLEKPIVEAEQKKLNPTIEKRALSPKQVYLNHTQSATDQFLKFLEVNVNYPEHLKSYCLEGEVVVEVLVLKDGTIKEAKISQSLQKDLDQLVLSAIHKMTSINLAESVYKGARRLRIPVKFSVR